MAKQRPACANGSFRARLKEVDVQPMRGALGKDHRTRRWHPQQANRKEEGQTTRHFPEADRQNPPPSHFVYNAPSHLQGISRKFRPVRNASHSCPAFGANARDVVGQVITARQAHAALAPAAADDDASPARAGPEKWRHCGGAHQRPIGRGPAVEGEVRRHAHPEAKTIPDVRRRGGGPEVRHLRGRCRVALLREVARECEFIPIELDRLRWEIRWRDARIACERSGEKRRRITAIVGSDKATGRRGRRQRARRCRGRGDGQGRCLWSAGPASWGVGW
jgi:hypothetical protein